MNKESETKFGNPKVTSSLFHCCKKGFHILLSAALFTGVKLSNRKKYTSLAFELSQDAKSFQKCERINSHSNSSDHFSSQARVAMRELESSCCYHAIPHCLFVNLVFQMRGHQCLGIGFIREIQFRLARPPKWERWGVGRLRIPLS